MLRLLSCASVVLLLAGATTGESSAACSYRTTLPSGASVSGWAEETSLACVLVADLGCPRCRPGLVHQCLGGNWIPLPSASCTEPLTSTTPRLPGQAGIDISQLQNRPPEEGCIYYDRDGRRLNLPPADLVWAEENGLVARKSCPPGWAPGRQ